MNNELLKNYLLKITNKEVLDIISYVFFSAPTQGSEYEQLINIKYTYLSHGTFEHEDTIDIGLLNLLTFVYNK